MSAGLKFERVPCPAPLAADPWAARPAFSADGAQVEWFLPGGEVPVVVPNPLGDALSEPSSTGQ